jgi:hypothetical protein
VGMWAPINYLETKFVIEELQTSAVLATVQVTLLELLLQIDTGSGTLGGVVHGILIDNRADIDINGVTSWHQMGEVDNLEERLDARATQDLLLGHRLGDLLWSLVDTSDKSMSELTALLTILESLDDHSLLTGITASENNNDLTRLDTIGYGEMRGIEREREREEGG